MNKFISIAIISLGLSACAYNQSPVVDLANVSQPEYQQDLASCEAFAAQVDKAEAGKVGAANSAAAGAGTGAIVGAFDDGLEGALAGAAIGAIVGGISGGIEGAVDATDTQARVLRNCLADKGYKVYDRES